MKTPIATHEQRHLAAQREPIVTDLERLAERGFSASEFLLISFWESYEAIGAFAGHDLERAVYYPRDQEFLLELEPKVAHYEVATTL